MKMECQIIERFDDLYSLSTEWLDLLERSSGNQPTLTPEWLEAWWHTFGHRDNRELCAVLLRQSGRLIGLVPLVRRARKLAPGVPVRRVELLGSGEDEADEICSDYIGIIAERGRELDVVKSLAGVLVSGAIGPWDEAVLPAMDGENLAPWALGEELKRAGYAAVCEQTSLSPYIPLPASWDAYLAQLSASRRYFINRSLRDFERWSRGEHTFEAVREARDLDRGLDVLISLHESRWQSSGKAGVFGSASFRNFHERVMPKLLSRGALELGWLSVGGEPVAAGYNIVHDEKVYFYQSGRKPDLPAKIRPGVVWHALAIQRAIERGQREYDFLAGASRYKMQFALHTRPIVRVRVVKPVWLEAVAAFTECVRRSRRRMAAPSRAPSDSLVENVPVAAE